MVNKVATTKIQGGAEYATVPDRLKEFRNQNPRASIETHPTITEDMIMFEAKIVRDKADPNSATATGHSYGKIGQQTKAFEKLETVAVGRALAILGYLNNGQIATTEEMAEFEEYQLGKVLAEIKKAKKREEFEKILAGLTPAQKLEATPIIQARIKELKGYEDGTA
jgi:hypothetical protein